MKTTFIPLNAIAFLLSAFFLLIVTSCNSDSVESQDESETSEVPDMHTSQIALDYHGTYTGVLPCANCEGIETALILKDDGKYLKKMKYLGKDDPTVHEHQGDYLWHANGQIITLTGMEDGNLYFVGENRLWHLDSDGNRITGELEEMYILTKVD